MMGWYPGKLIDRMRRGVRAQYWELPPSEATPERAEKYFELVHLDVSRDLDQAIEALGSALHELHEVRKHTFTLEHLDKIAGGKYTNIVTQLRSREDKISGQIFGLIKELEQLKHDIWSPFV